MEGFEFNDTSFKCEEINPVTKCVQIFNSLCKKCEPDNE